jgi:hypothetical protein
LTNEARPDTGPVFAPSAEAQVAAPTEPQAAVTDAAKHDGKPA